VCRYLFVSVGQVIKDEARVVYWLPVRGWLGLMAVCVCCVLALMALCGVMGGCSGRGSDGVLAASEGAAGLDVLAGGVCM
jgi:hypothetical protein